jgi:hypothetical protein
MLEGDPTRRVDSRKTTQLPDNDQSVRRGRLWRDSRVAAQDGATQASTDDAFPPHSGHSDRCDRGLQSPLPHSSRQPIDLAHLVTRLRELSDRVEEAILCDVQRMALLSAIPDIALQNALAISPGPNSR